MSYLSRIARFNVVNLIRTKSIIILRKNVNCWNQTRNKSLFNRSKKTDPSIYFLKDNIPSTFHLIYRNSMEKYLMYSQVISIVSMGLIAALIIFNSEHPQYQLQVDDWRNQPGKVEYELYVYITALSFVCVLLQYMIIKMPLRIYNSPSLDKYIFVFYKNIPTVSKQVVCKRNEIQKLPVEGIMPWKYNRYEVKDNHGVVLVDTYFRTPADLNIMLGLQKHKTDQDI